MTEELPDGEWITVNGVRRFFAKPRELEPPKRRVAQCGTTSGAQRHRRRAEVVCLDCLNAERDEIRKRRASGPNPPLRPHGTHAAFQRHLRNESKPCDRCVNAEREYQKEARRRQRAQARQEEAA